MKIKKMAGALALTAALAMGATPAFAASVADDGSTNAFSDNGSTEIKAKVDNINPNVRATVPLQVTVVFGSKDHSTITAPSNESYKISNIGNGAIKVTNAEITDANSYFTLMPIKDAGGGSWTKGDYSTITENAIMLTYQTAGNYTYLSDTHPLTSAAVADKNYNTSFLQKAEDTIAAGADLKIQLGGDVYFPNQISLDGKTDTLCKIKYTIASAA